MDSQFRVQITRHESKECENGCRDDETLKAKTGQSTILTFNIIRSVVVTIQFPDETVKIEGEQIHSVESNTQYR